MKEKQVGGKVEMYKTNSEFQNSLFKRWEFEMKSKHCTKSHAYYESKTKSRHEISFPTKFERDFYFKNRQEQQKPTKVSQQQ